MRWPGDSGGTGAGPGPRRSSAITRTWSPAWRRAGPPVRPAASARMRAQVDRAKADGETAGGVFVAFATGVPAGLGSHVHWDRRLDGRLLQAIGSIHAVKGAEVGPAFDLASRPGSRAVDAIVAGDRDGDGD